VSEYKAKDYMDCGIRMVAEEELSYANVEPVLWTRYHIYVLKSPGIKKDGFYEIANTHCHYGFDSRRTADRAWDELVELLDGCEERLGFVSDFGMDTLDLGGCEGRVIKYIEGGKLWGVFQPKADRPT